MTRFLQLAACLLLTAALPFAVRHDREDPRNRLRRAENRLRQAVDNEPSARRIVHRLRETGPAGVSLAFELLGHGNPTVRTGAAVYLGIVRSKRGVPKLVLLLEDPVPEVRRTAAAALGFIGDPRAAHFLRRTLVSDESEVAQAARRALQRLARAERSSSLPNDR
jgi:HEAT repeat protein